MPQNRPKLQEVLNRLYRELSDVGDIRPKEISMLHYLAQTWLSHIIVSINSILEKVPLHTHIPVTRNVGFYIQQTYGNEMDTMLTEI